MTEPTLAPPMAPSTVDMAQIFAAHAERAARIEALRPGNKDRLFDGLMAAGITHVTVTFDGAGDSGQIESIGAWSGETAVDFPATEIDYAALTWDDPEVEMRQPLAGGCRRATRLRLPLRHPWRLGKQRRRLRRVLLRRRGPLHPSRVQRALHLVRTLHPRFLRGRRWHIPITTPCPR